MYRSFSAWATLAIILTGVPFSNLHAQPRLEARILVARQPSGQELMPVFTPDGRVIALSDMHSVTLWNCKTGKNIATLDKDHITVGALAVSPDGKILCIAGWGVNPQNRNGNNPSGAQIEFWDLEAV